MTSHSSRLLAVWLTFLLVVGACGGLAADDGGLATLKSEESDDPTTTAAAAAEADIEEAALEFSQCMRDHGVTDFPDPTFTEGDSIMLGGAEGEGGGLDAESDEMRAAFEACREVLEGAAFGPGGGDFDPTELQDNLLAVAECLRDQGLEVDDPDLSNFGPVAGRPPEAAAAESEGGTGPEVRTSSVFGDLDMEDPEVRAAMEACTGQIGFGFQSSAVIEDGEGG